MNKKIPLFYPYVPEEAIVGVVDTLKSRWVGQGPKVEAFEKKFGEKFAPGFATVAVGAGTDALHLAYVLAGLKPGDEVITTVFTCTATNIPLLYLGAKIVFADVQENTLNIDPRHVKELINERTRAIVCVHYGGLPCDMKELSNIAQKWGIPIIEDAAHCIGGTYHAKSVGAISDFTAFSFMAVKTITTGDGGMLTIKNTQLAEKAKRVRWFGIDRNAKLGGEWENEICEIGYKYQMTDISAALGLSVLEHVDAAVSYRQKLLQQYEKALQGISGIQFVGGGYLDRQHAAWICTVLVDNRAGLCKKLFENGIDSNQVHYRNDRYQVFGGRRSNLPIMDKVEEKYLVLPLHHQVSVEDVVRICDVIRGGW